LKSQPESLDKDFDYSYMWVYRKLFVRNLSDQHSLGVEKLRRSFWNIKAVCKASLGDYGERLHSIRFPATGKQSQTSHIYSSELQLTAGPYHLHNPLKFYINVSVL